MALMLATATACMPTYGRASPHLVVDGLLRGEGNTASRPRKIPGEAFLVTQPNGWMVAVGAEKGTGPEGMDELEFLAAGARVFAENQSPLDPAIRSIVSRNFAKYWD
ncbi:hypothetical protein ACHZ97_14215 [Lysobacter soli]|uniref:hypothetical protein n=1 Tax=Lysobacter soli TaxID=453783 RepID=UPI0037C55CD3